MAKINIEVNIPGNAKSYEFLLDDCMKIGVAKKQIIDQVTELEGHNFFSDEAEPVFCSVDLEGLIQDGETFEEVGLGNGSRAVLL